MLKFFILRHNTFKRFQWDLLGKVQFVTFSELNAAGFIICDNFYHKFISMNMIYSYVLENKISPEMLWARRIVLIVRIQFKDQTRYEGTLLPRE